MRQKGGRIGRNPKTGEEAPILPRRLTVFRASDVLKRRINSAPTDFGEGQALERDAPTVGELATPGIC